MLLNHLQVRCSGAAVVAMLVTSIGSGHAQSLRETFKRVTSSVAVIETRKSGPATASSQAADSEEFVGSGFLISPDGKLLTAAHLVQVAEKVSVKFPQSEAVQARSAGLRTLSGCRVAATRPRSAWRNCGQNGGFGPNGGRRRGFRGRRSAGHQPNHELWPYQRNSKATSSFRGFVHRRGRTATNRRFHKCRRFRCPHVQSVR